MRSGEITRVHGDLRAFRRIYERSWRFTRAQEKLRTLKRIYTRSCRIPFSDKMRVALLSELRYNERKFNVGHKRMDAHAEIRTLQHNGPLHRAHFLPLQ